MSELNGNGHLNGNGKLKLKKDGTISHKGEGGGAPRRYTDIVINDLAEKMIVYAQATEVPLLKEFSYNNRVPSYHFSSEEFLKNDRFQFAYYLLKDKQELGLVKGSLNNKLNSFAAHNALKNMCGWRDRTEHEHTGNFTLTNLITKVSESRQPLELAHQ